VRSRDCQSGGEGGAGDGCSPELEEGPAGQIGHRPCGSTPLPVIPAHQLFNDV